LPLAACAQDTSTTVATDTVATVTADTAASSVNSAAQADTTGIPVPESGTSETLVADSIWYTPGPLVPVSLQPRQVPETEVRRLKGEDDFWYVSVGRDKPKPPENPGWWSRFLMTLGDFFSRPWAVFLLWSVLAGLLVAAIVAFIQSGSGESWFRRNRKLKGLDPESADTGDAFIDNPDLALQRALDAQDYGSAERWLYIRVLSGLGERGLIKPHAEKTNREYLRELRGGPLYDDFSRLLRHYEYTFYGGFTLGPAAFEAIRDQYAQFQNRLDAL
jgi:hypothetical protein